MTGAKADNTRVRLLSIDALRGMVMFLIMAEMINVCEVSESLPDSGFWRFLCWHQSHVAWAGCSLHDLIQPCFLFLVGVVLPFSIASRRARGESTGALVKHALTRSLILIVLGIVILSVHPKHILWKFEDALTQIGLGYPFLFALAFCRPRTWWTALAAILVGYWLFFALYPLPPAGFDYANVGVTKEWLAANGLTGFAAHWQKNTNPAARFDLWLLNLFPQNPPYNFAPKGLTTLNFIPSIGTMLLGLCAGEILRSARDAWSKARTLTLVGLVAVALGVTFERLGICPIVKSLWTPSWVLFSGGLSFLFLAAAYVLVDLWKLQKPAMFFVVIGTNSIATYFLTHFFEAFAFNSLHREFGWQAFKFLGDVYEPAVYGLAQVTFLWLILFVMYRLKIFIRI